MPDPHFRVELAPSARDSIRRHARASEDGRETGGVLLGHDSGVDCVIAVTEAGGPGPLAERRPDFFLRDLEHARNLGAAAWERGRAQWVGEWHTHPAGGSEPSARDTETYRHILDQPDLAFKAFVAVIVTPHDQRTWDEPILTTWVIAGGSATGVS